ncbi:hypothetical protein [Hyphomicrobium sp. MC1]|uniref:hypothetical protein n=1 Tax=Hyphomicrobium sp. (strain MC1) TaxID=717785 RepID=UPI000213DA9C|nr:hypothetical protein [Hyphomicrobium sp. MC1]CCB64449.1 protein of unknown function [Hyphomicrobium sp. MC1]
MTEQTLHEDAVNGNTVSDLHVKIKAILNSDLSDGGKFAAIAEAIGARGAEEIAAVVKKPVRTVERHYAELRKYRQLRKSAGTQNCGTHDCVVPQICVEKPANLRTETTQNCVPDSHAHTDITTRATKELPSEVVILENITPLLRRPPSSKTKPANVGSRGSRLPNDWELPEDWRQWTLVNCPCSTPETVQREALIFANYWQSLAGQKATKVDWRKTWQNWTLKTFATAPIRPQRAQVVNARVAAGQAELARLNARIAEMSA